MRGCSWYGEMMSRIPEVIEFQSDIFGGDLNDKIQRLEEKYSEISNIKESDEVNLNFYTKILSYKKFSSRVKINLFHI